MTQALELLFKYAQENHIPKFMKQPWFREAQHIENLNLTMLREALTNDQLLLLEQYQESVETRECLEQQVCFTAGFSIAQELR